VHPVFHVSIFKKFIDDPTIIVSLESTDVQDFLSYNEIPVEIFDRQIQKQKNKEVPLVKDLWQNQSIEGAT